MGKNNKRNPGQHRQRHHEGNRGAALSQAEIWDDSALIRSWNDAVQEYEYYHSIHARGEDVEEVLRRAEEGEFDDPDMGMDAGEWKDANANGTTEGDVYSATRSTHPAAGPDDDDEIEDGELDESSGVQNETGTLHPHGSSDPPQTTARPIIGPQLPRPTGSSNTAAEIIPPPQDQTLENLKMAYYWAGYYSGLYDGQQQAKSQQALPGAQPQP